MAALPAQPEQQGSAVAPGIPEGYVNRAGAARLAGVTVGSIVNWEKAGAIRFARWGRSKSRKEPIKLYAIDEIQRYIDERRGPDTVHMKPDSTFHIPDHLMSAFETAAMFNVDRNTLTRWEREGNLTCGELHCGGRIKVYPRKEIERLVEKCGVLSPPYADPDRPGCYRVPLSGFAMERREAIIDACDLHLVEGTTCYLTKYGEDRDAHVKMSGSNSSLHHVIMGVKQPKKWRVRHLNGDTLDCRRANLEVVSRSERSAGMRKAKTFRGKPCSSQFKGVCWDKRKEKWLAHIKKDQRLRNLGHFDDEVAAAEARDRAALELFGDCARLNFPNNEQMSLREAA